MATYFTWTQMLAHLTTDSELDLEAVGDQDIASETELLKYAN